MEVAGEMMSVIVVEMVDATREMLAVEMTAMLIAMSGLFVETIGGMTMECAEMTETRNDIITMMIGAGVMITTDRWTLATLILAIAGIKGVTAIVMLPLAAAMTPMWSRPRGEAMTTITAATVG